MRNEDENKLTSATENGTTDLSVRGLSQTSGRESQLAKAVEAYLAELEAGRHLEREPFIACYPEIAEELRKCLDGLELIHRVGPQLSSTEHSPALAEGNPVKADNTLGDFRIIGEIGRGGMGVVYEAQQISLPRRVAIKVLPFAAVLDPRQLERFKNEARAAATLDHPAIVSIYSVGCERGVHFFAMQFVEGKSLAEVIAELQCDDPTELAGEEAVAELTEELAPSRNESAVTRSLQDTIVRALDGTKPNGAIGQSTIEGVSSARELTHGHSFFRFTACLGMQAAEALDHAHARGIVHRDIKPGNLMLDAEGKVHVADFGLARIEADAGITMTGDILGTLRYMSPEQALSKRAVIDHRTDIYSLGATLYELATLRPLFVCEDRAALLRQIAFDVPKLPKQVASGIPRDLETIILKALEKDPNERYATARELADDLSAFLDSRPILAKPPSLTNRLVKWSRRHVGLVWTFLLASSVLAIGLAFSTAAITASRNSAERDRQLATEQRDLARKNEFFAQQLVYASDIRLAAQAWEDGDVGHYVDLLDRHTQSTSIEELRGFEWRYLRQLGTANFHTIATGAEGVCSVRFSPDGKYLAAGQYDGKLQVRDGNSYRQLAMLSGHQGLVRGIDFSPDSKRLVSFGYGGVIRIWELETFREIRSIRAFENTHGYRVCFALDGQAVIAIAENSPTRVWDVDSGELIEEFGANGRGCWGLAVSPDGQSCVVREPWSVFRIWNLSPRKPVAWMRFPLPDESAYCVRYSPAGVFIAAGTDKKLVRLFEARTGKLIATFAGHDDQIWDIAFHPSGTMLASCDLGGVIRTWHLDGPSETSDAKEVGNWPPSFYAHSDRVWSIDFSPDGKRLVSASKDGTILAWTGRDHVLQELDVSLSVAAKFSPSGDELFIARDHSVARWDRLTNGVHPFGDGFQEQALSLAISPTGEIMASGHESGIVRLWNRKTEQIVKMLRGHEDRVSQIAFSPTDKLMVTASWDGTAKLWDVATGKQRYVIEVPPHCLSATFSPDGQTLAVSSENDAMLYDAASGRRKHLLKGHQNTAECVAFSPDGRWLATGSWDRTIRIWDVGTGKSQYVIPAHREEIYSVAFSTDGQTIVTGDDLGTIAFSHVETGRFLFDTKVADGRICHLSFSPNGKTLAATCKGKQVVLLHAPELPTFGQTTDSEALIVDAKSGDIGKGMIPKDEIAWVGFNQNQRLTATDENFGYSVSISGDTAIVGAPHFDNSTGAEAGAAYVYVRRGGEWIEQQKLTASNGTADDRFGVSVSVDGDTAIVGARQDRSGLKRHLGSATIYTRIDGVWSEQQKLTASDIDSHDHFGHSVSLSGNTAIIGAHGNDDHGANSGSAYLFIKANGVWTEQKKLTASDGKEQDNFGYSVSISGNSAVVGAWKRDGVVRGVNSGSVYVFTRNDNLWSEKNVLVASDGMRGDRFGHSVSVSGDTLVVGAPRHDGVGADSGKAYIFTRSGNAWDDAWKEQSLTPSIAAAGDVFGHSVAISGNTAIVGAWRSNVSGVNSGSAYLFSRRGERWIEQPKLSISDSTVAKLGFSVSVDGSTIIVGSRSNDKGGDSLDSAHIFQ